MRSLLRQTLTFDRNQPPNWRRALRVTVAIGLPLFIAIWRGEFLPAVYGGVAGLYSMFVDNGGPTPERIVAIVYMTVGMLLCGIAGYVGRWVPGAPLAFLLAFSLMAGWLQGTGTSVELMSKYWLIAFLFGNSDPRLSPLAGTYLLLGGLTGIVSVLIDRVLAGKPEKQFGPMLFEAISRLLRRRHSNGHFTFYFASKILAGYAVGYGLGLTRAYWVPLTIAIVTVYDPQLSIAKLIQRLAGSLLGALVGWAVLTWCHDDTWLALISMALGAATALLLNRSYWMAVVPITALVMVLLDFGYPQASTLLAIARVENTVLGCAIAGLGALIYLRLQQWLPRERRKRRARV
ncbi:MAG: FUSC family protein [Paludibacterium sp.]|uniref:FUSC family protein n=1 Tax=Paludibacterium sp. TaxID=1917523 RepID=UPI0025F2DFB5|nr:FUSC family protein [Paludibacterium sp.]MBV8048689.1 FUSC family protein [Paludibacterium sp.]MBV8646385.1 FUSC family protein [Paludibacterium sp.]